jgi:hypothetical protein
VSQGWLKAIALAAAAGSPYALAQSTNVLPDLTTGAAAFDPAKVAGTPRRGPDGVASAVAKMRNGELEGLVLVASPHGVAQKPVGEHYYRLLIIPYARGR